MIIPVAHMRQHEISSLASEDLIKSLDAYHSEVLLCQNDPFSLEERLQKLFGVKDKWTLKELYAQLKHFCDPE